MIMISYLVKHDFTNVTHFVAYPCNGLCRKVQVSDTSLKGRILLPRAYTQI